MKRPRIARLLPALAALLASCAAPGGSNADLDAPIFGSSHATTFVISPSSGVVHAGDLAAIARVLRRYKTLTEAERVLVKSAVARRLDALISLEVRQVMQEHAAEREAVRRSPDRAQAARRLEELDTAWRKEAMARVVQRLGKLVAVPLKTSDNRSAVAFANITSSGIEVAKDADEIDRPIASLIDGEGVQVQRNEIAKVVSTRPVPVGLGE